MKEQFKQFLDEMMKSFDQAITQKDKHHDFDMAFGGLWLLANYIDTDNFEEYNDIWNEYHEIFRQKGALKNE